MDGTSELLEGILRRLPVPFLISLWTLCLGFFVGLYHSNDRLASLVVLPSRAALVANGLLWSAACSPSSRLAAVAGSLGKFTTLVYAALYLGLYFFIEKWRVEMVARKRRPLDAVTCGVVATALLTFAVRQASSVTPAILVMRGH